MRMVDIDDFIEDQLSVIDASVVNLLQGWGYTEGDADEPLSTVASFLEKTLEVCGE